MQTADPVRAASGRVGSRVEFETLIADTAAALVAAAPEELGAVVERCLGRVRLFFGADRCALLAASAGGDAVHVLHASYGEGIPRVSADVNLAALLPWTGRRLFVDRQPVRIANLGDIPPEETAERAARERLHIRSALSLPLETRGTVGHIIILNAVHAEIDWPEAFIPRLRVLGDLMVAALDRQATFERLRRADEELSQLGRRLIEAHEAERALLARELHDDVTQRLAVLAIDVGREELAATDPRHAAAMRTVRDGLVRLSEDVHALAYQLHPSVLEELGLAEALRTECERLQRRSPLAIALDLAPLPFDVGKDAALCLFRVAQEALSNVVHHAAARSATLTLRELDGGWVLSVRDDGRGFVPGGAATGRSLGLASMRERVDLVRGALDIESAPGEGTTVTAWVPAAGDAP